MSGFFDPRAQGDSWFRVGRIDITSTVLVVFIGVLGMIATPFVSGAFILAPQLVVTGELWRIFTWPLHNGLDIFSILNLLLLWYFGTMLESELGRARMMRLYVEIWVALTVSTMVIGLLAPGSTAMAGVRMIEFVILLLWIAEYPTRRFFFNIPAWGFGAFLLLLQVLPLLAAGAWAALVALAFSFLLVALAARRLGLLSAYKWLPGGGAKTRRRTSRPSGKQARQKQRTASDEERLDVLLGKISAEGIHSLSKSERAELEKIRQRRRR